MNVDDLKSELPDVIAILQALAAVIPDATVVETVEYLDRATKGSLDLDILHAALQGVVKGQRRLRVG